MTTPKELPSTEEVCEHGVDIEQDCSRCDELVVGTMGRSMTDHKDAPPAGDGPVHQAERLAVALWEKHWRKQSPDWKPLSGDLTGLLLQIDNMTAELVRAPVGDGMDAILKEQLERPRLTPTSKEDGR